MTDTDEFEGMFDGVLRKAANPEPVAGFAARMQQGWLTPSLKVFEEDGMAASTAMVDGGLRKAVFFAAFWERIRSVSGLTPLVLESRSGSAARREERGFGPVGWAVVVHGVALLLLGTWLASKPVLLMNSESLRISVVQAPPTVKMPSKAMTAGGGGGQKSPAPAAQGRLPKISETQIIPPKTAPVVQPKIAIQPTVVMLKDLKMTENVLPNLGMPNSPVVGTGSLGNGSGTGIGSGNGAGVGAGSGGNMGGGAMRVGGGVSAPVPVFMPDPEFSEEARKAKVSGNVLVYLWVDEEGRPTHVRVVRGIGMGLDERAIAAVRQYRFKPARKNGSPVTVEMNVEVNFQIF